MIHPTEQPASDFRLLFLDLDGTLVGTEDVPSPRTVAAIHAAQDIGCHVVVCTGRNRHAVEPITAHWQGNGAYGVYNNGAVICDLATGETIHKLILPTPVVQKAAELAHSFGLAPLCYGSHVEKDGGEVIYTDHVIPVYPPYLDWYGYRIRYSEGNIEREEIAVTISPVDIGVYGPDHLVKPLIEAWEREIGAPYNLFNWPEPRLGPDGRCAFIDHPEADKVFAVQWIAQQLNIPQSQVIAIGDQLNDLRMLEWAGLGVCMGNGHPQAKACAAHVTADLSEDGAALAIERFVLGW